MTTLKDNNIDSSQYEKNETEIIKIQGFCRGCLGRAGVSKMVQKMIDDIVSRRRMASGETKDSDADATEHSTSSFDSTTIKPKSYSSRDVSQGSVNLILSKFESINEGTKSPQKSYSPRKIKVSEEEKEEKKEEEKQPFDEHPVKKQQQLPTIEPLELAEEEQKHSKSPTEGQKNSYVKNMKLRSNATSHVSSSEKVLVEQGVSVYVLPRYKITMESIIQIIMFCDHYSFADTHRYSETTHCTEIILQIRMDKEIQQLLKDIKRVGEPGEPSVDFGDLFDDEEVANYYEALVGTLKAAKKKKLIGYDGQYLMKGVHDKVVISIL